MKRFPILFTCLLIAGGVYAQQKTSPKDTSSADALLNSLKDSSAKEPVVATFKSTKLILTPTTETNKKNNLNFIVTHRFGDFAGAYGGGKTLVGLDNISDDYIGFEYGLTNNLDIDFGRSKFEQLIELGAKYNFLHQTSDNSIPFSMTVVGDIGLKPYMVTTHIYDDYSNRLSYFYQAIIARKFSSRLSLEISPSFLRDNLPYPYIIGNEQNIFSLAAAGRFKITQHMGIVVDYTHPFSNFRRNSNSPQFYDPIGVGIEIETGGHVFSINFTNAPAISPINYISDTESNWLKGQFKLGFTITRIFDMNSKHKGTYK